MIVETYSDKYLDDVLNLVKNFHLEAMSEYDNSFDPEMFIETIKNNKNNSDNAFLLIIDDKCQGMLYGTRSKSMIGHNQIFQEIMWYVNEKYRSSGVRLLRYVENLLKSQGISIMIMAVLENSKTEKIKSFYSRLGYKQIETHFMRTL